MQFNLPQDTNRRNQNPNDANSQKPQGPETSHLCCGKLNFLPIFIQTLFVNLGRRIS